MPSALLELPLELFDNVLSLLTQKQLVALTCASKKTAKYIEPLLWTHIELFPPSYHSWKHTQDVSGRSPQITRVYRRSNATPSFEQSQAWSSEWFARLHQLQSDSPDRAVHLCAQTISLSAPVHFDEPVIWQTLPMFTKLERLELVVNRVEDVDEISFADGLLLPALRYVRLFGYVPAAVVELLLRSAATIEHLAVGALDSSCRLLSFHAARESEPDYDDIQIRHLDLDELNDYDTKVDPRPLRWVPESIPAFSKLTHLHLYWPTEMDPREFEWGRVHHFRQLEEECLNEFVRLITSTASTLQSIVLDQRMATHECAQEGANSEGFMKYYSSPSNARTVKHVLPMLQQVEFRQLENIDFAGLLVHDSLTVDEIQQRKSIVDACAAKDIECSFPLGRRCIYECDSGAVYPVDGIGADSC